MDVEIDGIGLIFWRLDYLSDRFWISLGHVLGRIVRNAWLSALLVCTSSQNKIIYILQRFSLVWVVCIWLKNFTVVFVPGTVIRLIVCYISIVEIFLISSGWFRYMCELLLLVYRLALSVSSAFWLCSLTKVICVNSWVDLLISGWHSFLQKLQTASRLFDVLTAIIGSYHWTSLRCVVVVFALSSETALVARYCLTVARVEFLSVHALVILIWKITAIVTPSANAVILYRV